VHQAFVPKEGVKYFMSTSFQYQDPQLTRSLHRLIDDALAQQK